MVGPMPNSIDTSSGRVRTEFLVSGAAVGGTDLEAHVTQSPGIEVLDQVATDVVVMLMTEEDRAALAERFRDLAIEPNAPLEF